VPTAPVLPADDHFFEKFDSVCKFIDNFCASGHFRGSAETLSSFDQEISISLNFEDPLQDEARLVAYQRLQPKSSWPECLFRCPEWLLVRKDMGLVPATALTYRECLTPDFYVQPLQFHVHGNVRPREIFLPRNLFCFGIGHGRSLGMLDVSNLTLLFQSEWFTVLRYQIHDKAWIIKCAPRLHVPVLPSAACDDNQVGCSLCFCRHTSLNSVTFKYLLQEKAMFVGV
jgi:hypothetical protein